jgi:hypothetical protein
MFPQKGATMFLRPTPLFASLALLGLAAQSCMVYTNDTHPGPVNYAPVVVSGEAGCYWNDSAIDYDWYFDADLDDANGPDDITEVWADIYDDMTGEWVDSFELYWVDGYYWSSDWYQSVTWLDCSYPYYSVDLVPYDFGGLFTATTFYPIRSL